MIYVVTDGMSNFTYHPFVFTCFNDVGTIPFSSFATHIFFSGIGRESIVRENEITVRVLASR